MRYTLTKAIVLLGFTTGCLAMVIPRGPYPEELHGTWVGFDPGASYFYRMEIRERGGLFATSFSGQQPELYRIDSWNLGARDHLKLALIGVSTNASPLSVDGSASSGEAGTIRIRIVGPRGGSPLEAVLYNERMLGARFGALKRSVESSRLRTVTGKDLGDDPGKWLKEYSTDVVPVRKSNPQ
ncbi:MAG TPA: hypothetical protein VMF06_00450 [Candidatus Limnocylindria bacterium]|jgi:hypothetical protein|nr:hypothetical protein [Candidatus Limnocylindria bacterium]